MPQPLRQRIEALRPWFHALDLGDGRRIERDPVYGSDPTYPAALWKRVRPLLPPEVTGMSVLDVGCNSGFFCLELKRLGAARVVGLETHAPYFEQARLVRELVGLDLELHLMSVYDVPADLGSFDLTLFLGVLYHLRHPLLGLERLAAVTRGMVLVESAIIPEAGVGRRERWRHRLAAALSPARPPRRLPDYGGTPREVLFLENADAANPAGEALRNWFVPSMSALVAMVRAAGFDDVVSTAAHGDRGVVVARARSARPPGR